MDKKTATTLLLCLMVACTVLDVAAFPKRLSKTTASSSVMSNTWNLPAKGRTLNGLQFSSGGQTTFLGTARNLKGGGPHHGRKRKAPHVHGDGRPRSLDPTRASG